MKWGGFLPFSLSDFPGCVAAIAFTRGCNFNCVYCHNRNLIAANGCASGGDNTASDPINTETIVSVLKKRQRQLDGLVITGGEPTCQKDLVSFARGVKTLGYRIKLDTNGTSPNTLEELISESLVDYVAMDVKAPWHKYAHVTGVSVNTSHIRRSVEILSASRVLFEFRVTAVSPLLSEKELLNIGMEIGAIGPVYLQPFRAPADHLGPLSMPGLSTTPGLQQVAQRLKDRFQSVYVR